MVSEDRKLASRSHAGFGMLEILVALAIFSLAIAGLAGLSLANLRSAAGSHFNVQATYIAEELADSMRANLEGYETGNFISTPEVGEKVCSIDSECTAQEQAQYDSGKWQKHALYELPGGVAILCMDSTPNDGTPDAPACDNAGLNTVKIFWKDTVIDDATTEGEIHERHSLVIIP